MQLSAVCAAVTVSAQPRRQTEKCCSRRLTFLTLGQHTATDKTEANKQSTMSLYHWVMLSEIQKLPEVLAWIVFFFQQHIYSIRHTN